MPAVRDSKLDLAKAVLIVVVVLGHFLEAADTRWKSDLGNILRIIYMVHMPAFVFLAGITSRARGTLSKVVQWLTLFVVFSALYWGLDALLPSIDRTMLWYQPYWILWFLVALAAWQALMPVIEAFPRASVLVSVAVGACSGLIDAVGYPLTLSRATVFLPFFVIGAVYGKRLLAAVERADIMVKLAIVASACAAGLYLATNNVKRDWLYGSRSFDELRVPSIEGVSTRLVLLMFAMLALAALWVILPRREGWWTLPGKRSLSIYLLHGVPVTLSTAFLSELLPRPGGAPLVLLCACILTAASVALFSLGFWDKGIRAVGTVLARRLPDTAQGRRTASIASK